MYINAETATIMVGIATIVILIIALIIYNHHANARNEALLRIDRDLQERTLAEVKEIVANGMKAKVAETGAEKEASAVVAEPVATKPTQAEERKDEAPTISAAEVAPEGETTDVLTAVFADLGKSPLEEETEEEFGYIPYRRGQSGHVYSKDELAVQIRD